MNGGSGLPRYVMSFTTDRPVYEHRSCRIIKGTMVRIQSPVDLDNPKALQKIRFVVVPEIGSSVLDIKDVDLKKPDRFPWNMPGHYEEFHAEMKRKYGEKPPPKADEPPKAGTPVGYTYTPFSVSHPKKPRKCGRVIGDLVEYGHLDDDGEFVPDPDLPMVTRAGVLGPMSNDPHAVPRYYTLPTIQKPRTTQDVYEFRSGRLIKGKLEATGNFIPEVGSKIIDFKDHTPDAGPRIYNLPGTIKKNGE